MCIEIIGLFFFFVCLAYVGHGVATSKLLQLYFVPKLTPPFSSRYEYHPPNNFYIIHPVPIRPYASFHPRSFSVGACAVLIRILHEIWHVDPKPSLFLSPFLHLLSLTNVQITRIRCLQQIFIVALTDVLTDIPLYIFCSSITNWQEICGGLVGCVMASGQAVFDPTRKMTILIEVETESECACHGDKEIYIPAYYNYCEGPLGFLLVQVQTTSPGNSLSVVSWLETGRLFVHPQTCWLGRIYILKSQTHLKAR